MGKNRLRNISRALVSVLLVTPSSVQGFSSLHAQIRSRSLALKSSARVDLQADSTQFGRGEQHLSASLNEGDVVVYQTGSWLVDGVVVGDGTPPVLNYCIMETIQVVWTHNCEHGVLRGRSLAVADENILMGTDEVVEFGPEQLVGRIPTKETGDDEYKPLIPLEDGKWKIPLE